MVGHSSRTAHPRRASPRPWNRNHVCHSPPAGSSRGCGRVYGSTEQSALQVLCGQLAVAIENAELFTEVQNAKIYNEILLQNLTTGVIAADADGSISVFNGEAEKITGLDAKAMLGKTIRDLPGSLCHILETTLQSGERQEDREIYLRSSSASAYARASSSTFHSQDRQLLGALIVIT